MTQAEWEEAKTIFADALALPVEERAAFVLERCGSFEEQRSVLLELLENHSESSDSFGTPAADTHPVLKPDDKVAGRFRIFRLIAAGGMGEVYEAWDESLSLKVALKTVRPELMSEAGALDRFKRELLVARRVSHENVCRVFDFVEHRRAGSEGSQNAVIPCFTMEFLDGETLAAVLSRRRPLSCDEALPILRQIVRGLGVLHEHSIVHRDLKPSNIMIVPRAGRPDRVVVMDFGLAKSDPGDPDWFQSATEFRGGALYFMAPEILRKARPAISSDVYSLGLVIDDMVTTSRAFSCTSPQGLAWEKLWQKPTAPSTRSGQLPASWEHVILRCLDSEPARRFDSVQDVIDALEQPGGDDGTHAPESSMKRVWRTRRRFVLGLAAGLPLAGATGVAALALQPVSTTIDVYEIRNATGLPEYDYFCKGTTSELTRQLLQLEQVRVYALRQPRNGNAAGVGRFLLDGMLQAHKGQIRLSVQLSDSKQRDAVLWSDNFDREALSDPLSLQTDIARSTVTAVERRVLFGGNGPQTSGTFASAAFRLRRWIGFQEALASPPTRNGTAFDLYMRGHHLLEDLSPATATAAIEHFKRAIENDSQFALAYSSASDAYMTLMNYNYAPHPELARSARYYAERAVEIDPNLAEGHSVLAAVRQMDWDREGAEKSYREALRLKPNYAKARRWYAGFVLQFGRTAEAVAEGRQALALDPYDASAIPAMGLYLFFSGMYSEAIDMLSSSVRKKDTMAGRNNLCQVYAWMGGASSGFDSARYFDLALEQANGVRSLESAAAPEGRTSYSDQLFALAYALHGRNGEAMIYLARLEADMNAGGTSPVTVAWIYSVLKLRDRACDHLERAATWRDRRLLYSKIIPFLNNLHGHPRFDALIAQMNLV